MNNLSLSILVCCLLGVVEFVTKSQAGIFSCICGGGTSNQMSQDSRTVSRPDVPDNLSHLSQLNDHLTTVDPNSHPMAVSIRKTSLPHCVGHYMRNHHIQIDDKDSFDKRVLISVLEPCQQLDSLLNTWYWQVEYKSPYNSDSWHFTERICKEILRQDEEEFLTIAYKYFLNHWAMISLLSRPSENAFQANEAIAIGMIEICRWLNNCVWLKKIPSESWNMMHWPV